MYTVFYWEKNSFVLLITSSIDKIDRETNVVSINSYSLEYILYV